MKKSTILIILLSVLFTISQNQAVNATKKSTSTGFVNLAALHVNLRVTPPNLFLQFVGGVFDPLDSTIIYDRYGSGGSLSSVIVFKSGVQQSSAGISITGSYHSAGTN